MLRETKKGREGVAWPTSSLETNWFKHLRVALSCYAVNSAVLLLLVPGSSFVSCRAHPSMATVPTDSNLPPTSRQERKHHHSTRSP
ncbi:hypothetical protein ATANTOWER_018385 [Ataeniobius toweri]|uniref:Transmembrane protein n=1 Tax=Ataeniobius toweri TaxID=208326 RepID=A0ABU7A196_9TELE|nr:hypothetical protein [Ataeniobius toweri]